MKRGRKPIEINKKLFENMCAYQCTLEEIAGILGVSMDTIERWCKKEYKMNFAEVFAEKRQNGRYSLRRAQFQMAMKNPTMAIFLGKQYLGQKDDHALQVSYDDDSSKALNDYIKQRTEGVGRPSD